MFESMTKDKDRLRNYRKILKKMKIRLTAQADHDKMRSYIPATFDAMMVDFGTRVERKELLSNLEDTSNEIIDMKPCNNPLEVIK